MASCKLTLVHLDEPCCMQVLWHLWWIWWLKFLVEDRRKYYHHCFLGKVHWWICRKIGRSWVLLALHQFFLLSFAWEDHPESHPNLVGYLLVVALTEISTWFVGDETFGNLDTVIVFFTASDQIVFSIDNSAVVVQIIEIFTKSFRIEANVVILASFEKGLAECPACLDLNPFALIPLESVNIRRALGGTEIALHIRLASGTHSGWIESFKF